MMRNGFAWALLAWAAIMAVTSPAAAQPREVTPLFTSNEPIRLSIRTDLRQATRSDDATPATLTIEGAALETHQIELTPRGVSRRRRDICTFPPLRINLPARPEAGLLQGQRRIKLVTHCQERASHQQYLLLEYDAYRLYNAITPRSFNVRLAQIDYYDGDATEPDVSRYGFLIEDVDDAAERNGLFEVEASGFSPSQLSAADTARVTLFQYMIGNLDWAVEAGPAGEDCCHNTRPIGASGDAASNLVPMPYDFDFSGLVSAPYAEPPAQLRVSNVRTRVFRGFCSHNNETRAAAAEFLAARSRLEAVLASIPDLTDRTRSRVTAYLGEFFDDISAPAAVQENLLDECLA